MPYEIRKRKRDREQKYDDTCAVNSNPQSHNRGTGNFGGGETGKLTTSSATTSKLKKVTSSRGPNDANSINHDQDDDGQVNQSQWNHLPHTILAQIYSYLDPIHQRRASITCKQWRDCYFSPNLWRDVQLCPAGPWWLEDDATNWKGAEFVLERCGKYIRNLQVFTCTLNMLQHVTIIKYTEDDVIDGKIDKFVPQITSLLRTIHCNCKNLESLQLKLPDGLLIEVFAFDTVDVLIGGSSSTAKGIWRQIAGIVKKSPSLKRLQLDHIMDVIGYDDRLQHVAKTCGNSLKTLNCSMSFTDTDFPPPKTYMNSLKMMNQLTDLRLNLPFISDELLLTLSSAQHCPMKVIEILISDDYEGDWTVDSLALTNNAWVAMRSHSEDLQVGVVCYYGTRFEALAKVLELSAIPLKWLKIISFTEIEEEVFSFLQNNFHQHLQRLDLVNIYEYDESSPLTPEGSNTSPVVMTVWACSNLTQLNVTGFEVISNDIVGIVRLHGNSLWIFGVEESCIVYEEPVDTRDVLVAEVRKCLTQDWEPLDGVGARMIKWDAFGKVSANNWGSGPVSTG